MCEREREGEREREEEMREERIAAEHYIGYADEACGLSGAQQELHLLCQTLISRLFLCACTNIATTSTVVKTNYSHITDPKTFQ